MEKTDTYQIERVLFSYSDEVTLLAFITFFSFLSFIRTSYLNVFLTKLYLLLNMGSKAGVNRVEPEQYTHVY